MNSNTVFNFNMGQGIQPQPCIHSADNTQKTIRSSDTKEPTKTINSVVDNTEKPISRPETISQESGLHRPVSHPIQKDDTHQETQEDIPLIHRVFDRDKAKNFTEYALSRPTTFAHKCEEMMAGTCVAAIMTGIGAIGTIYHSDIIPYHNQIALGFACATGVCLAGTVLSGVAGCISECWKERKNRLMQEKTMHTRD